MKRNVASRQRDLFEVDERQTARLKFSGSRWRG